MDVTIKDIAADAGVSVSTVSRVMNGSGTVREDLKRKVLESIAKYNYKPNMAARSLVTKNTDLVAVLEADVRNPVTAMHLKQINDVCLKHNKIVLSCDYDMDNEKALFMLDKMLERNIDGLIFNGVELTDAIMEKLRQFHCPVVLANQGMADGSSEFTTVTVDSYNVSREITEFFIREGHTKIAYVGGSEKDYTNGYLRYKGYRDACEKAGLEVPDSYVVQGEFGTEGGEKGMRKIYENSMVLPTAIVTGSDIIAVGVIRCLKSLNISVPGEISVFGIDDSVSDYFDPQLSTVRMFRQGEILYEALFGEQAEAPEKKWIYFPYKLIRRNSTRNITMQKDGVE